MDIKEAHKLSFKNKQLLKDDISCFFCFRYHKVTDIEDWLDNGSTGICPWCTTDCVLPGIIAKEFLIKMHEYYFKVVNEED